LIKPSTKRMNLKILHLSDLHCKAGNTPQDMVLSSLAKKVKELCAKEGRPNLLLITGDIAHGGKPEQYQAAQAFIDEVMGHCGLGKDRIFLIPGNHDVDRDKIAVPMKKLYKFEKEAEVHDLFASEPFFKQIKATTDAYFEFARPYMPNVHFGKYGEYALTIPFGQYPLRLVGLNSALFCGYDGDDKRQLALGLEQVHKAFEATDGEQELVIGMVHHPAHCFHECDQAAQTVLHRNADLILSGHLHDPRNSAHRDGNEGETVFIAAGAGYETRTAQNAFNIIEIDADALQGKVVFYKYLPNGHQWIVNKDINHHNDGVFPFAIRKGSQNAPAPLAAMAEASATVGQGPAKTSIPIPRPPAFYAKPHYLASHDFVGRKHELEQLDYWASPADSFNLLLYEAVGGSGKSMLTWHWVNQQAATQGQRWTGIFWYSFYEKGAVMADCCRHALAYITGQPLEGFLPLKTLQLRELLLPLLKQQSWLLVLDGLERVLNEYDSNQKAEESLEEKATEPVTDGKKDPCGCINPEDEELLRQLALAKPSKILVSSRLRPRALENSARQPVPGVKCQLLAGLRPPDGEDLFRQCGISGDGQAMQDYLVANCGGHPLTIGALAGIINDHLPARGDFDAWLKDSEGAGQLNMAHLDLKGKQNHILDVAMGKLPAPSLQMLSTLALLNEGIDYPTLAAFNPHLPPQPEEVEQPEKPEEDWDWDWQNETEKEKRQQAYKDGLAAWQAYQQALKDWKNLPAYKSAPQALQQTVKDLERRGLLQYHRNAQRYDLHPVVRGVAAGRLSSGETEQYGQQVVDYLMARPHNPYENASSLEELADGLHVVRTLLRMGHYQQAYYVYKGDLSNALFFNIEAYRESLTLLRSFFTNGWAALPPMLDSDDGGYLANDAAIAWGWVGEHGQELTLYGLALIASMELKDLSAMRARLSNIHTSITVTYAVQKRLLLQALRVAVLALDDMELFRAQLDLFDLYTRIGDWVAADTHWQLLHPMGRNWSRAVYRPGMAEYVYAASQFYRDNWQQSDWETAFELAQKGSNRGYIRSLYTLQGQYQANQANWPAAADSFGEAVRLARAANLVAEVSETGLALARYHLGQLPEPEVELARLSGLKNPHHNGLARLYWAMGNREQAAQHALKAYKAAWGVGEPYVHRYWLNQAAALLTELGEPIPPLPPYDPAKDEKFPWEEKLVALIAKLEAEKAAKGDDDG
jgi:predicted MPP superfamily phosphohydrolase